MMLFSGKQLAKLVIEKHILKSIYPGTKNEPGYVRTYTELIEYPCKDDVATDRVLKRETVVEYDDNDCTDGKVAGAILGGGLGAAMSKGDGRWWAIPIGAVVGSKIGCDAAGG